MVERTQNNRRLNRLAWHRPLFFTGILLLFQAFPLISPVRDAATLLPLPQFSIHYPLSHLILTPFCSIADTITVFSDLQEKVMVVTVFLLCLLCGGIRKGLFSFILFLAFIAWGVLIPRPMGRLVASDPNTLLIDFHSHTRFSHDGRPSFTPDSNRRWHERQGYNASFITDHNLVTAAEMAKKASTEDWKQTGYRSLEGEEVSLRKTHLVILGNRTRVDNVPYDRYASKIFGFVQAMHARQIPVIASLPEYWLYHWNEDPDYSYLDFMAWGMDGFEIVNSAPKALDFPLASRAQIVDLCRAHNLFITGISDTHGYGYATAVWNAMEMPGWRSLGPGAMEKAVIRRLKTQGFKAVQVVERVRFISSTKLGLILTPAPALVLYLRMLTLPQCAFWIGWIWIISWLRSSLKHA